MYSHNHYNHLHCYSRQAKDVKELGPLLAARWKQFAYIRDTPEHIIKKHADNIHFGVHNCYSEFLSILLCSNPDVTSSKHYII